MSLSGLHKVARAITTDYFGGSSAVRLFGDCEMQKHVALACPYYRKGTKKVPVLYAYSAAMIGGWGGR